MSKKATGGVRLKRLFLTRDVPRQEGVWLDCYSNLYNEDISGCITTRISDGNEYFVTTIE